MLALVGDWVFIVPSEVLSSSPLQVWNQSSLPGAIDGMETILDLGEENNDNDYYMWIKYKGNTQNDSFDISLQFTFEATFRWEKSTGVLLAYEIIASMEGEYQNYNANFNLELNLERKDFLENNIRLRLKLWKLERIGRLWASYVYGLSLIKIKHIKVEESFQNKVYRKCKKINDLIKFIKQSIIL